MTPEAFIAATEREMLYEANERGLAEIREILAQNSKHHKGMNPGDIPNEAVYFYADKAEDGMNTNGDGRFEIHAMDSVSGNPMVFSISDTGFDVEDADA